MKRISAAALLFSALPLFAQNSNFGEKVDVNLVLVDATVTDSRGNQILGLRKDDFIIKENGVAQEIASVDYYTNRRLLDSPEAKAAFQVERVKEARYFILFFDKLLSPPPRLGLQGELMRARDAAIEFIDKRALPEDRFAVAGFDSRLKIWADFTSDKTVLKKALAEAVRFTNGLKEVPAYADQLSILRNLNTRKMINDTGRIYDAVEVLADALPKVQARKVMVFFSVGIGELAQSNPEFLENEEGYYQPMLRALNKANVAVYPVNLLRNRTDFYPQEQTLSRLATETGGDYYRNIVNFATPLRMVERQNNGYYMVTYYAAKKPSTKNGYQKIDVALRNREFRIKAREGYAY